MIGKKILHYQITEKLGEGGMGEVYLADDTRLHRRVALKFVNRTLREDREAHDRLVREARSASQLGHANIVAIHAIEEVDDHLFIAMEYVEGRSLRDVIKSGTIDKKTALDYGRQILEALAAAHEKDIVHRDIKSDNIKVTDKGQVKVLDFGLARSAGAAEVTRFGSSAGTPAYMAPELVHGEKADNRSDLFSFGVLFYEMLTGRRPFKGEHESAVTYSIVNEDPEPITTVKPGLPRALQPVIDKLLAKTRDERYQSANQVLADLSGARRGGDRVQVTGSKPKTTRLVGLLVLLAVVVMATVYIFRDRGGEPAPQVAGGDRIKLVVLPFENLGAAADEYFADGITEEVTTSLAKLSGLGVISRTSAIKYKGSEKSLKEIGEELDVAYALEGTIRWDKSGGESRVRINTQLIRVSDDTHLWADRFDRVFEQIFTLESEIAENVAKALNVTLLEPEREALAEAPTDNMEAFDYYLKARDVYARAADTNDYDIATKLLEQAVALDSTFSLAHSLLARYYTNDYFNNRFPDRPRLQQGLRAARAARRHNPDGPEGHVAMGYYHYYGSRDYENALAEFEIARAMEPNDAAMLQAMGFVQRRQGNWEEAFRNLERAMELDPTSLDTYENLILTAFYMRRYKDADRFIEAGLELAPQYPAFRIYVAVRMMLEPGDIETALVVMETISKEFGPAVASSLTVRLEMLAGNYDTVLEMMPNLPAAAHAMGEADSANYYLMKGLVYDLKDGLGVESPEAIAHYDSARAVLDRRLQDRPEDHNLLSNLAYVYAGLRDQERAYYYSQRSVEVMPLSRDALAGTEVLETRAVVLGLFGDTDEALDIIELLLDIPSFLTPSMLEHNPIMEPLKNTPRFKELMKEKRTL